MKKQHSQLWVRMDRGLLRLQDAIQKQETTSACVKKTAGIGWNTLEAFVILRTTSCTPSLIVSAVFSKSHNSFTWVSNTSRTASDVWTCIFKLQRMLVSSRASTLCSFPESVTLWLHYFNPDLYNWGWEERNAALSSSREWHPVCSLFPIPLFRMHSINYWREVNRYPCRFSQKLFVQFHSAQSSRGASFLSFVFITAIRILIWSLEMPSLRLWRVILEATTFSSISISESWCWCESTPFPMRWWLMRSRPVQCIPVSFILSLQS